MKKVWIIVLVFVAAFLSMIAIKITANVNTPFDGLFGQQNNTYTYDHIYMISTPEQQELMEYLLAEAIQNTSITTMTVDEAIEIIMDLKQTIVDDYDLDDVYPLGMMGNNQRRNCHDIEVYESFEWVYLHSSQSTQYDMMEQFVTEIQVLDMTSLTTEALVSTINEIKTMILTNLID